MDLATKLFWLFVAVLFGASAFFAVRVIELKEQAARDESEQQTEPGGGESAQAPETTGGVGPSP